MELFVLTIEPYHENSDLVGVFSSLEKAKTAADAVHAEYPSEYALVTEVTLDTAHDPDSFGHWETRAYCRRIPNRAWKRYGGM